VVKEKYTNALALIADSIAAKYKIKIEI